MPFDPEKASDIATGAASAVGLLAVIGGFISKYIFMTKSYGHKVFISKEQLQIEYVAKVNQDGTRNYVHPSEFAEVKSDVAETKKLAQETNDLIKAWINHP